MRKGYKQLLEEADARIDAIDCERARRLLADPGVQFVDLRENHELERHGMIPGAFHAPRGNLEFWVDPQSPYHRPVFASGKHFIFYCGGGWRSALATLAMMDMGLAPVSHLAGGFSAWRASGAPIAARPPDPGTASRP